MITIGDHQILAGNSKLMKRYHISGENPSPSDYGTEVLLARDGKLIGCIIISDTLKEDAKSAIQALKAQGLHTVMLTGDSAASAEAIARETGIDTVYSHLLPDEKLQKLKEERSKNGAVMFIGDGINDAPVLAGADCGAAMGSGADAAIEAADVVFMRSSVSAIPEAIRIGKKILPYRLAECSICTGSKNPGYGAGSSWLCQHVDGCIRRYRRRYDLHHQFHSCHAGSKTNS